jgi:hypothetical protein
MQPTQPELDRWYAVGARRSAGMLVPGDEDLNREQPPTSVVAGEFLAALSLAQRVDL